MPKKTNLADKFDVVCVAELTRLRALDISTPARVAPAPKVGLTWRVWCVIVLPIHAIAFFVLWLVSSRNK